SKSVTPDYYDRLAVAQALNQLAKSQADLTRAAIRSGGAAIEAWLEMQGPRLARVLATLDAISNEGTLTLSRLLVAAGQLQDVASATDGLAQAYSGQVFQGVHCPNYPALPGGGRRLGNA